MCQGITCKHENANYQWHKILDYVINVQQVIVLDCYDLGMQEVIKYLRLLLNGADAKGKKIPDGKLK